ncbi:sortase domain-bontaining protein [Peribacillus alkalitolerans]|uniref:sortase domain-containing protein n=1 Tax=Peribacillus alkalitolerans TaxID=1550385 RepID=UPI0013D8758E
MESTSMPDEEENMVLAGHRSRRYGNFFNQLEEMEKGETITIKPFWYSHLHHFFH